MLSGCCAFVSADRCMAGPNNDPQWHSPCCQTSNPGQAVLPAKNFSGQSFAAYAAAKKIPEVCCKLFCYCGCDIAHKHESLLECFASDHSDECAICRDEVFEALRLHEEGKSIAEIQQSIDQHFSKEYPEDIPPSKILLNYRARRRFNVESANKPTTSKKPAEK
jgi:hypothetical protein